MDKTKLPNGADFILRLAYTSQESHGIVVLVVISCFSIIASVGLVAAIALSAYNTRDSKDQHLFVRNHVAAYFLCIVLSDLLQSIGSIMNSTWIRQNGVSIGDICTTQAVIKHMADVSAAFWTLVVAIHTFCLLVIRIKLRQFVLWTTLFGGWSAIFAIVISGPAVVETPENGPFYTISGYWCWISPEYPTSRITLDYMLMFLSAAFTFILYVLIYLNLRGNFVLDGWKCRFVRVSAENLADWRNRKLNDESLHIAKSMSLYPLGYSILIIPMAITRFLTWTGHDVSFAATVFSDAVFLLSGVVNTTLFACTRSVLPPQSMQIFSISRPVDQSPSPKEEEEGPEPYYSSQYDPYYQQAREQKEEQDNQIADHLNRLQYEGRSSFGSNSPSNYSLEHDHQDEGHHGHHEEQNGHREEHHGHREEHNREEHHGHREEHHGHHEEHHSRYEEHHHEHHHHEDYEDQYSLHDAHNEQYDQYPGEERQPQDLEYHHYHHSDATPTTLVTPTLATPTLVTPTRPPMAHQPVERDSVSSVECDRWTYNSYTSQAYSTNSSRSSSS